MTKNQYNCEVIQPENFERVMGAFSIALILSVPGTNLRICAFLQVVCAVETEFLPLCASWPEQNIQVGLSKPQKRHFYTVSASCVVITSGRKIAAQRKVTDKKSRKRKSEKNHNATKKREKATQRHPVPRCGANQLGQFQRRHLALRVW